MEKLYCPYCGAPLTEGCRCEQDAYEEHQRWVEEREEEQHRSGFYAFQDLMEMYRRER